MQETRQHYSTEQERGYTSADAYQQNAVTNAGPTSAQKLALAITSLGVLVLLCIAIMGFLTNGGKSLLSLPALVLASVLIVTLSSAIIAINFIFNYKH